MYDSDEVTPGELRALAREHTLILEPGEVLIVTVPPTWSPRQVGELNDALQAVCRDPELGYGITVLAVPGTATGVGRLPEGSSAEAVEKMLARWHDTGPRDGLTLRERAAPTIKGTATLLTRLIWRKIRKTR